MRTSRFFTCLMSLVIVLAMVVAGCSTRGGTGSSSGANSNDDAAIVVGHAETIRSMDPHKHTSVTDWMTHFSIYDPLVMLDSKLEVTAALAERWEVKGNTYTFYLRKGVKFHDGTDFTAEDVKFTLERMYDPKTASPMLSWWPKPAPKITVVDPFTISVELSQPNASFLGALAVTAILPKSAANNDKFFDNPVGTGPYKFVTFRKGELFEVERNDNFWGGKPKVKKISFKVIPDASARVAALLAGDIDLIPDGIPPENLDQLKADKRITVQQTPTTETRFLVLNNAKAPFDNPKVREALYYAIDAQSIADTILKGTVGVGATPMSSTTFGYPEGGLQRRAYDPARAKQLLAEAGYPNGFKTTYLVYSNDVYPKDGEVALAIQNQLKQVGIDVEIVTKEIATALADVSKGEFAMSAQGCAAVFADFSQCAAVHYGQSGRNKNTDTKLHELVTKGVGTTDAKERQAIYKEAAQRISDGAYNLFLFDGKYMIAHGPKLAGLTIHPTRINALREQIFSPAVN